MRKKNIVHFFESYKIFNPKLFIGLILIFVINACSFVKNVEKVDSQAKEKKTKKEKPKKERRRDRQNRVLCYCPSF